MRPQMKERLPTPLSQADERAAMRIILEIQKTRKKLLPQKSKETLRPLLKGLNEIQAN